MDEEEATLESQFANFSRLLDNKRTGLTMTIWRSDFWMRQSKVMDDRKLTMTDTGIAWFKFGKTELTYEEWYEFLTDVCEARSLNQENVEFAMTNCGMAGVCPVYVPQYRDFFDTFKPKSKMMF